MWLKYFKLDMTDVFADSLQIDPIKSFNKDTRKMDTKLYDINQAKVREAFIDGTINLTYANRIEIATILRIAVTKDDTMLATAILDQIPDILKHENGGGKILWQAMENGNEILAQKLIFAGADLNYRSRNGTNILHCFMRKYETIVSLMIERGADVNITDSSKNTILYVAVRERLLSIVETFAKLDIKYEDEERVLKEATSSDYSIYLIPLLIKSSDIARKNARARIALPLYLKVKKKDKVDSSLVRHLIDAALMPNHTNSDVVEILKTVVKFKDHTKVVKILLDYVDILNDNLDNVASLLCQASKYSESTMSQLLIQKGANIHYHTKDHEYPLHSACRNESLQNIHLLLSLGADLTVVDNKGRTPFSHFMPMTLFREQHKLVLRHLAIYASKQMDIDPNDSAMIKGHFRMRIYYDDCLNELLNMKRTRIYGDTTFFCFFDKNVEELCSLARHYNFLKTYYLNQKEGSVSFPRYSMQIHHILKMAVDRKNIFIARAKMYEEAIMSSPPYDSVNQVDRHMSDLDNFELKYYCKMHELINNPKERNYRMYLLY